MYQSNSSHLYRSGTLPSPGSFSTVKPPLPTTKPPVRANTASQLPRKMQSLDSSVVNRFLQSMENLKSVPNGSAEPKSFSPPTVASQSSHLWKKSPEPKANGTSPTSPSSSSSTPSWVNKTLKPVTENGSKSPPWVSKLKEPSKPNWSAKTPEESKTPPWKAEERKSTEISKAVWNPKAQSPRNSIDKQDGNLRNVAAVNGTQQSSRNSGSFRNAAGTVKEAALNGTSSLQSSRNSGSFRNGAGTAKEAAVNGTSTQVNSRLSFGLSTDWKMKYEETDKKRKELLVETQKVEREKSALERRLNKLEADHKQLEAELQLKSTQLNKLSNVSEKVYQDYDKLNNKYAVETAALHRALGAASKWYVENKKLRRASVARGEESINLDEIDGDGHELDELKKTVEDLSKQVVQLQSDLNKSKLQECDAQKQISNLSQQLDEERENNHKLGKELKEMRLMKEKFGSVAVMVQGEVETLRQQRDKALEEAKRLQGESHEAKKERNVLAHQSSLLRGDIGPDDRLFNVLLEVEDLKRQLEESEHKRRMEVDELQERIYQGQTDSHVELIEEKLSLLESELQLALERAEQAEQTLAELKSTATSSESNCAPCPAPPPPPPPPPPMMFSGSNTLPIARKPVHRPTEGDSLEDMARLLGIQRTPKPPAPQGGAIDDIINEIKGGKFTLKATATEKTSNKKEEQPAAVQEMLSIIGTLKRRPKRTSSFKASS